MSIETLIKSINDEVIECGESGPVTATLEEITQLKDHLFSEYKFQLPDAMEHLLSLSNGILFNGLTIWPTRKYWLFHESFTEANTHLRESFNKEFIYFGTRDEELYIYNLVAQQYQAIEYVGEAEWNTFPTAQSMFEFMLSRALD